MGDNLPHGPFLALSGPSRVVAKQTVLPAHAPSPRATDVATHCLAAVEEPYHVPDRASTNGVRLS